MSLADELKNDYRGPIKEVSAVEGTYQCVKEGITKYLKSISSHERSVTGYYCIGGYETDPSIRSGGSEFFIVEDLGKMRDKILNYNKSRRFSDGDYILRILTRREFDWLIRQLNAYFNSEGFSFKAVIKSVGLRNIACGSKGSYLIGKVIFTKVPAYGLYLEIAW